MRAFVIAMASLSLPRMRVGNLLVSRRAIFRGRLPVRWRFGLMHRFSQTLLWHGTVERVSTISFAIGVGVG